MKFTDRWEMPEVCFYRVEGHGFASIGDRPLFAYGKPDETDSRGRPKVGELYESLDRAMIAWVGEKYTGVRGAGGTGVGTAADWFARMIGMDQLTQAGAEGRAALALAWKSTDHCADSVRARAMERGLENQGYVIAAMNHGR